MKDVKLKNDYKENKEMMEGLSNSFDYVLSYLICKNLCFFHTFVNERTQKRVSICIDTFTFYLKY